MFPDVCQCLLENAGQVRAVARRAIEKRTTRDDPHLDAVLSAKPSGELGDDAQNIVTGHFHKPQPQHEVAHVGDVLSELVADLAQSQFGHGLPVGIAPKHLDLHFEADQRLEEAVVQLAGQTCAFGRHPPATARV